MPNMLTGWTAGNARGGSFWVGVLVDAQSDQWVSKLGVYVWPGVTGTTTVALVDQTVGGAVRAQVAVNMTGHDGAFVYGSITPFKITAGTRYAVTADSSMMGQWSDANGSDATYTTDFVPYSACYNSSIDGVYQAAGGSTWWQYVGVDLVYGAVPPIPEGAAAILVGV